MSFKENLLQKIEIDALTRSVLESIGPPGSGRKVDKEAMRGLLDHGTFTHRQERDLNLYLFTEPPMDGHILVLDNELAIYRTSVEDVLLRKSPTVKEMLSIRNAIKILSDGDVVVSKREDSVLTARRYVIDDLDLSYRRQDLDALADEGAAAFERGEGDGVAAVLQLFAEILDYQTPPRAFRIQHHVLYGKAAQTDDGAVQYGPLAVYSYAKHRLAYIDRSVHSTDKANIAWLNDVARGDGEAALEGAGVFTALAEKAAGRTRWVVDDALSARAADRKPNG